MITGTWDKMDEPHYRSRIPTLVARMATAHTVVRQDGQRAMCVTAVPPAVRQAEVRVDAGAVSGASSVSRSVEKTLKSQIVMS